LFASVGNFFIYYAANPFHLLLTNCADEFLTNVFSLIVCEPMTRRCSGVIEFPSFLMSWDCFGAFLLDGNAHADETRWRISVSNFRIIVTVYDKGVAWTSIFSSAKGDWFIRWDPYAVSWSAKFFLAGHT
jgi:hypothetical protein